MSSHRKLSPRTSSTRPAGAVRSPTFNALRRAAGAVLLLAPLALLGCEEEKKKPAPAAAEEPPPPPPEPATSTAAEPKKVDEKINLEMYQGNEGVLEAALLNARECSDSRLPALLEVKAKAKPNGDIVDVELSGKATEVIDEACLKKHFEGLGGPPFKGEEPVEISRKKYIARM